MWRIAINTATFFFWGCILVNRMMSACRRCFIGLVIIALAALAFVSCSGDAGERSSEITSVVYDTEDAQLEISATLDSADVREFRGETIYLIEIPANNSVSDIVTLIPVAQSKSGAEMSFAVPLKDGARTRLYSSFVLAVFDRANGYIALSDARYVDNPDALAQNKDEYPLYSSIKGLSIVSSSDAISLGAKHTVIRIPIEEYILPESAEGAVTSVFDGNSHYFNASKVAELDYKIKNLTGAGIEIYLEFTLGTPPEELPAPLAGLASKTPSRTEDNADDLEEKETKKDSHYAISVTTGDSYRQMAAFFEFLAERYTRTDGKYGFAAAYILGHGVNSLTETGIDDARTLTDSVSCYAKLLNIASTALRSKYAEGKVFISLDNKWTVADQEKEGPEADGAPAAQDPTLPFSLRDNFGGAEYLEALICETESSVSLDFGVALMPIASDGSSMVWSDIGSSDDEDTEFLTVKNLSAARSLIGKERELMIYNYGISSDDEISMAASYAYAYLKAAEADVSAFIYNGHFDGATGNGETGLWSVGEDGGAAQKREIYEVFKYIDVKDSPAPKSAEKRIGSEWTELWEKYESEIKSAVISSGTGSTSKDEDDKDLKGAKEKLLFDFGEGKSFDFFPSDSTCYLEVSEYLGDRALKSAMIPKYKGENMGVRSAPIAFETINGAKQISTVISADGGEGNTVRLTLALAQSNGEESLFHTGDVKIQSGNRQTVYFDISDAGLREELGDVTMYLWVESNSERSPFYSGGEAEENLLYIENISAAVKKSNRGIIWTVLIIILLATIVAILCFMFLRQKKVNMPTQSRPYMTRPPENRPAMGKYPPKGQGRNQRSIQGQYPLGQRPQKASDPRDRRHHMPYDAAGRKPQSRPDPTAQGREQRRPPQNNPHRGNDRRF